MLSLYVLIGKANAAFGLKLCIVYMNDDPEITLIYIMWLFVCWNGDN